MSDTIFLKEIPKWGFPVEDASVPGYVKHVKCEGARFHVLSLMGPRIQCSEKKCIINKPIE